MFLTACRGLIAHALPVLVAQLASIGMVVVDTAVLGHVGAIELAAVAIGGGIYVCILFALVGILQAVTPIVAHRVGAGRDAETVRVLRQGFWLALALSVPGIATLIWPDWLLGLSPMEAAVEERVRGYLLVLACGVPASLLYRTFYSFSNALGRARLLMAIGLGGLVVHAFLSWGLALKGWAGAPLGVLGCAVANVSVSWLTCGAAALSLIFGPLGKRYRAFEQWEKPDWVIWRELLQLGLPMGVANFVEISAFTLVALLIAPLGATVLAGHRIIGNIAALCYMLPLAFAIATLAAVGQSLGARDWARAHRFLAAGLLLAGGVSSAMGVVLWFGIEPMVALYTNDASVRKVAVSLVIYIAIFQFFDAVQTVAGHVLRAYRVTFLPMLVQTLVFWGIGMGGGWWLCFGPRDMGIAGFWLASAASLMMAAILLAGLLWKVAKDFEV